MILSTVRTKIIANSALVLFIIASATFYTGLTSLELAKSVEILFRNNLLMEKIRNTLHQTEIGLAEYLTHKNSDSLRDYIRYSTKLSEETRKLNREIRNDPSLLLQKDLAGVIDRFIEDAEASVMAKRGRDVKRYTERYENAKRSAELARFLITRIEEISVADSLKGFTEFNSQISAVIASNAVLVLAATLMGLMLLVRFSYKLTDPLSRLAEAARAVGRGEYQHVLLLPETGDEIGTTAAAFSRMQESIRHSFEELKSKSEVEKRLMEERMRVLDMSHKLKNAELLALQTQINPHFLFNTLSAGMQLALFENSEKTADFLENLAAFIRYVLKPPSRLVKVSDEIECVKRYIWLLQQRFGTRYRFEIFAEDYALTVETPALLLQPLVENAITHGLKNREDGGVVRIAARLLNDEIVLSVEDSGDGMNGEEIKRAFCEDQMEDDFHEGGIGLRNVIRRVSLVTAEKGRVEIESLPGLGTSIWIHLPVSGVENETNFGC